MQIPVENWISEPNNATDIRRAVRFPIFSLPATEAITDWIDRELGDAYGRNCGKGGNILLELRRIFAERSLNRLVFRFYAILPRLEKHHYLLGFRIRTLLSARFQIKISDPLERSAALLSRLPRDLHSLRDLRRSFFEHAESLIPLADIRTEIIPLGQVA